MKVTSLPTNREVYLPDPTETEEETKLLAFKTDVLQATRSYVNEMKENKDVNGYPVSQHYSNLTEAQKKGVKSLKEKCKDMDLVIMETDKSKKLSLMTKANYVESTEPHGSLNPVVSHDQLQSRIKELNAHALQLSRSFMITYDQGDFKRLKRAMANPQIIPPPLHSLRKDHKYIPPEMKQFGPPSRPVGDGNNAPDTQLS